MMEFMKKAMDWVLDKEREAAKNCHASPEDIDKQIRELQEQRQEKLAAADPELAELYRKVNGMREKARKFREGKGHEGRGKGKGKHHGVERDDD